jgi:ankyrin repeat protein
MHKSLLILTLLTQAWAADTKSEDFIKAIRANDLTILKSLAKTGIAEVRDRLDSTPLHYAALYGSTESVRILLEAGADPNARNRSQATPLM